MWLNSIGGSACRVLQCTGALICSIALTALCLPPAAYMQTSNDPMKECHFIPFYSTHVGKVKVEYCNLDADETIIRGIRCTRRAVEGVPVYRNGVLLERCFQWVPANQTATVFDRGVELCRSKLGVPTRTCSVLTHFLKKRRR